jgi:hypothetical protein
VNDALSVQGTFLLNDALSVRSYASDGVATATKVSSPDFEGLAGLPLLRLVEYGGNANWFWLRAAPASP